MTMCTRVSVVMAVCNGERFLGEAVRSVLSQTHRDFELLAVDDGSSDGSFGVLQEFARQDKRVLAWTGPNRGVAAAVCEALERARHELIVRFDADDVMLPHRLERQIKFMEQHPEASAASSYAWLIDRRGEVVGRSMPEVDVDRGIRELNPERFINFIQSCAIMRKSDLNAVGGYSRSYRFGEDRELWGRLVAAGYRLQIQPEFLCRVRLHRKSLTASATRRNELTCRYIDYNIVRALQGLEHVSFDSFLEARRSAPLWRRTRRNIYEMSEVYYKEATRDYAERRWFLLARHCTLAMLLNPAWGLRMFRKITWRGALPRHQENYCTDERGMAETAVNDALMK